MVYIDRRENAHIYNELFVYNVRTNGRSISSIPVTRCLKVVDAVRKWLNLCVSRLTDCLSGVELEGS